MTTLVRRDGLAWLEAAVCVEELCKRDFRKELASLVAERSCADAKGMPGKVACLRKECRSS